MTRRSGGAMAGWPGRGGFALPMTVLCLLIVSMSLAALLALSLMEERGAVAHLRVLRAEGEAERNAIMAISAWPLSDLTALPAGSALVASAGTGTVRRMSPGLFVFSGTGAPAPGVYRRRSLLLALRPPPVGLQRALTSGGAVQVAAGAFVAEPPPRTRTCDLSDSTAAGWVPQTSFGGPGEDAAMWRARAELVLAGGTVIRPGPRSLSGTCVPTDPSNWGDPGGTSPCAGHGPVVTVAGDATVTGGVGQGVLVVDGDLVVRGGFRYHGLVLVGGRLEVAGAGASFRGAVQVEDRAGVGTRIGAGGRIAYSTCSLDEMTRRFGSWRSIGGGRWHGGTK